jgi:co-chaperonin GroES (HSP10)
MRPVNKEILIELIEKAVTEGGVLIPSGFKEKPKFSEVVVIRFASDVSIDISIGDKLLVLTHMIETYHHKDGKLTTVPQSAVKMVLYERGLVQELENG